MLRSFGPILRPGGRLIVVASSLGTLDHLPEQLWPWFDGVTLEEVEQAVEDWRRAIHDGTAEEQGWPEWINLPSKVAQVAAVRAVAAESAVPRIWPTARWSRRSARGWSTRAPRALGSSDFSQAKSPAEAVAPMVDVILADRVDPAMYGELIRDGKVLPWK